MASERKDHWISKQLEQADVATEGPVEIELETQKGKEEEVSIAERASLQGADPSVRAAVLGKGEREDMSAISAAQHLDLTPTKDAFGDLLMQEGDDELQDGTAKTDDLRLPTLKRAAPVKRSISQEDNEMGDDNKVRRSGENAIIDALQVEGGLYHNVAEECQKLKSAIPLSCHAHHGSV